MHNKFTNIRIIGQSIEKFIAIETKHFRFIDSYAHVSSSLEKITNNLKKHGKENFVELRREYNEDSKFELLLGKGKFPYEYLTDENKLDDTNLNKSAFYSSLNNENISREEYEGVQKIIKEFQISNLRDLLELYVKQDVLILCDCMNFYRNMVMRNYNLEAMAYFSSPALSLDAALKMTSVEIELIQDPEQYLFIENGVRGGVSIASTHHCIVNNKYLSNFDSTKESNYILYADVTNLYGFCLSQRLPISGFKWEKITIIDLLILVNDFNHDKDDIGYIVEVDINVPEHLHDFFNDYPPIPEQISIRKDMLSPWTKLLIGDNSYHAAKKMSPNLYNKTKYICHITNLQLYISLGLQLVKVHRVLSFKQSPWLFEYIEFNTIQRKLSKSTVEKDFFKLLINSLFGKMIENVRKYKSFTLSKDEKTTKRLLSKASLVDIHKFDDFFVYEHRPIQVKLCKPIFVGMVCLDFAKHFMVKYHYHVMIPFFGRNNIELLYTDTDSFIWEIKTNDLYKDLKNLHDDFDFSNYPKDHFLYNTNNMSVRGKWKDEKGGLVIKEVIFLRSKSYSILDTKEENKAASGVKYSVKKSLNHNDYYNVLFNSDKYFVNQKRFGSEYHEIFTYSENKCALSSIDDKRYQCNKLKTLAYGHYLLNFKYR